MTLGLAMLALLFPQAASLSPGAQPGQSSSQTARRFIINYDLQKTTSAAVVNAIVNAGGSVQYNYAQIGIAIADSDSSTFLSAIKSIPYVEAALDRYENFLPPDETPAAESLQFAQVGPTVYGAPQDAYYLPMQWNLHKTQTVEAWDVTWGSPSVKVAVLDTGICSHHQDLAGKVRADLSRSFVTEICAPETFPPCIDCPDWEDRNYHGTHVAGTIVSNNIGSASIAPNVELVAVKVLDCSGFGDWSSILNGIIYAAEIRSDVINLSLGAFGPRNDPEYLPLKNAMIKAINFAGKEKGSLVVMSAGNDRMNFDTWPGNKYAHLPSQVVNEIPYGLGGLSISSTTIADFRATYSNYGLKGATMSAPGGGVPIGSYPPDVANTNILAPCSCHSIPRANPCAYGYSYLWIRGTSMATPHVSGAAALIASRLSTPPRGSYRAPQIIREKLMKSSQDLGVKGTDPVFGAGRLNTLRALQ
jgi:subtilisin family serine protease